MKGLFTRATVHAAALLAVEYWQGEFNKRRGAWVRETAERRRGFFNRKPIGFDLAEQMFGWSGFAEGAGHEGVFWHEHRGVEIARRLALDTSYAEPNCVILNDDEMWVIGPVLAEAPLAESAVPA